MTDCTYLFQLTPLDIDTLLPQVEEALKKRTELMSRSQHPTLWKQTDRLRAIPKASDPVLKRRRVFRKLMSVLNLSLGILLFVPGLMDPKELLIPLVVGALAIVASLMGLFGLRKVKTNPFAAPASALLAQQTLVPNETIHVLFTEDGMEFHSANPLESESKCLNKIPYEHFEYVIETTASFLLTYNGVVTILQPCDLITCSQEAFSTFLSSKVLSFAHA